MSRRLAVRRRHRPRPPDPLHVRWTRLRRLRRRHHRLGAAGRRRRHRRAQLQVLTARAASGDIGSRSRTPSSTSSRDGRREPNARATTAFLEEGVALAARSVNAAPDAERDWLGVDRRFCALHAVGLLLQDLPVAELEGVRAGDPRRGRPRPHRSAMEACGPGRAAQPALRGSRHRRGAERPRGGARRGGSRHGRAGRRRPTRARRKPALSRRRAGRRGGERLDRRRRRGDRSRRRRVPRQHDRLRRLRSQSRLRAAARRRRAAPIPFGASGRATSSSPPAPSNVRCCSITTIDRGLSRRRPGSPISPNTACSSAIASSSPPTTTAPMRRRRAQRRGREGDDRRLPRGRAGDGGGRRGGRRRASRRARGAGRGPPGRPGGAAGERGDDRSRRAAGRAAASPRPCISIARPRAAWPGTSGCSPSFPTARWTG